MEQFKQLALTWFRAAAAEVLVVYMTGEYSAKTLIAAGVAGLAGPVLKWLDPSAAEFGRGSE